jgi:hypothetical protein
MHQAGAHLQEVAQQALQLAARGGTEPRQVAPNLHLHVQTSHSTHHAQQRGWLLAAHGWMSMH